MARPLSLDLRKRIVRAVEGGLSRRAAAARFAVSQSCAIKLVQRWKRTGSVAPAAMGAPKGSALAAGQDTVTAKGLLAVLEGTQEINIAVRDILRRQRKRALY